MSIAPLAIEITCVCFLSAILLHHYGNWRKQHVLVTLATFISWYFSFMIIFILPLDVSSTAYRQCLYDDQQTTLDLTQAVDANSSATTVQPLAGAKPLGSAGSTEPTIEVATSEVHYLPCQVPWSHVPNYILPDLWHVVYWTSQVLTWLVLPMMQSYANAGDFTVLGKIKSALIENAIYYCSYLLIFVVCLIYVAARPDIQIDGAKLKVIGITASNTWGLFLLVLLLGYGLVDVPRTCWENSKRGQQLEKTHFKLSKMSVEKSEAEENLEDVLDEVKAAAQSIRRSHPLRQYVETILEKCPEPLQQYDKRRVAGEVGDEDESGAGLGGVTEKSLIRLHRRVIRARQDHHRTQCQWKMLLGKAFHLQDIAQSEISAERTFRASFRPGPRGVMYYLHNGTVEWYWQCLFRPWLLKALAVILALFSAALVWSECTFFSPKPVLSIFANLINLAETGYDYFTIEVLSILVLAYLCVCAYYTVFRIRLLNYFQLVPNHQTDENSLIFSGMLLCRLTPPLCLNFLGLIHLDSHITKAQNLMETSYTQIMGHMDVISFISDGFNIYFPIAILLLCLATFFHLGSRALHLIGFQQFVGDDEMTSELIEEGKELLKRERRRRERLLDGETRRRHWQDRLTDPVRSDQNHAQSSATTSTYRDIDRSPDEGDMTGLLHNLVYSDPVDYNQDDTSLFDLSTEPDRDTGYQQQNNSRYAAPPSQHHGLTTTRPPKRLFDDV